MTYTPDVTTTSEKEKVMNQEQATFQFSTSKSKSENAEISFSRDGLVSVQHKEFPSKIDLADYIFIRIADITTHFYETYKTKDGKASPFSFTAYVGKFEIKVWHDEDVMHPSQFVRIYDAETQRFANVGYPDIKNAAETLRLLRTSFDDLDHWRAKEIKSREVV